MVGGKADDDAVGWGLEASGADNVIIFGGESAVGSAAESDLNDEGFETDRLVGANRWETATEVADALVSAPYLGELPAPLVLTPGNETNPAPEPWFEARGCDIETIHVFGGHVAVRDSVAEPYAETACASNAAGLLSNEFAEEL